MGKKQKIKKETWLVFYQTESGSPTSFEAGPNITNKEEAMAICKSKKAFKDFLRTADGTPIVKKLVYV